MRLPNDHGSCTQVLNRDGLGEHFPTIISHTQKKTDKMSQNTESSLKNHFNLEEKKVNPDISGAVWARRQQGGGT